MNIVEQSSWKRRKPQKEETDPTLKASEPAKKMRDSETQTNGIADTVHKGGVFPGERWLLQTVQHECQKQKVEMMQLFESFKMDTIKTIEKLKEELQLARDKEAEILQINSDLKLELETLKSNLSTPSLTTTTSLKQLPSSMLNGATEYLEQQSKMKNLRIVGLSEENGEDLEEKIIDLVQDNLNLTTIDSSDIETACRLGKVTREKTREVLVRFRDEDTRNLIYKCRRNIPREAHIYINEDLTAMRGKLYYDARQLKRAGRLFSVWSQGGNIIIKMTESSIPRPVESYTQLQNLLNPRQDEELELSIDDSELHFN